VHAVDAALSHIASNPATGSPRYAEMLAQPRLRSWLIPQFSYIILYIEQNDNIDVIRILHQQADIPAHLDDDDLNLQ
jgi:toxin ParE1/3/4